MQSEGKQEGRGEGREEGEGGGEREEEGDGGNGEVRLFNWYSAGMRGKGGLRGKGGERACEEMRVEARGVKGR